MAAAKGPSQLSHISTLVSLMKLQARLLITSGFSIEGIVCIFENFEVFEAAQSDDRVLSNPCKLVSLVTPARRVRRRSPRSIALAWNCIVHRCRMIITNNIMYAIYIHTQLEYYNVALLKTWSHLKIFLLKWLFFWSVSGYRFLYNFSIKTFSECSGFKKNLPLQSILRVST